MRSTRKRRKSSRTWLTVLLSIFIVCLLMIGGFLVYAYVKDEQQQNSEPSATENNKDKGNLHDSDNNKNDNNVGNNDSNDPENNTAAGPDAESYTDIRIAATGDIMFHDTQL